MMNSVYIAGSAAAAVFFLSAGLLEKPLRKRDQIDKRIKDLPQDSDVSGGIQPKIRKKKLHKKQLKSGTKKELEKLENELYDVGINIPVSQFLMMWATIAFLMPMLLTLLGVPWSVCIIVAAMLSLGPIVLVRIKKKKRTEILESQLVEAISVLSNALRAGHSFQSAMNTITIEMSGPIAEEFGRVFRETQHGMTMADSMERMVERTGSSDLEMLCTAILIQRDVGGNLAEVLDNISLTIQRRLGLKAEIKTRTASGRLSGYIIGFLPILLLIAMTAINPDYCSMLFTTDMGHMMLIIGAVMEVVGILVINRMVDIKY